MIIALQSMTCDVCKKTFAGFGPFTKYQCKRCRREMTMCRSCRRDECPQCGGRLQNLDEVIRESGDRVCW